DIILTSSSTTFLQRIITSLYSEFAMTDLEEILERAHIQNCNTCRIPVDTESKHGLDGDPVRNPTLYRSLLHVSSTTQLSAYTDADWAGFLVSRQSTFWYCMFLSENLLSWSVKCQVTLSRSSAEAEYKGVANVVAEITWICNLLCEFHTHLLTAILVYCDNENHRGLPMTSPMKEFRDVNTMNIALGTPPVSFSAIMDTESDLIRTKCKPDKNPFPGYFDPSKSSSYVKANKSCDAYQLPGCKQNYVNGSVPVALGQETLTIGCTKIADVIFARGKPSDKQFKNYDGVVGLGHDDLSLVLQLNQHVFSYCLASRFEVSTPRIFLIESQASSALANTKTSIQTMRFCSNKKLHVSSTTQLSAYTDADWAGCPVTHRSTFRYCVFLSDKLLSWSAKRLVTLSRSSAEAKYQVYCDNVSAVYMSANPVQHQRTKHIELNIHFVRDFVASGQVRVLHTPSRFQYADIFTKGLPSALFIEFRSSLNPSWTPEATIWTKCKPDKKPFPSYFDPSKSSSYVKANKSCDTYQLPGCKQNYVDGSVTVALGQKTLTIGSAKIADVIFACGKPSDKQFKNYDGVVGLGRGDLSLVLQLDQHYFTALKRILCYVRGTLDYGLQLHVSSTTQLSVYTDWAGCPVTCRSTFEYCVFLGDNLLLWSAKRQVTLSRSSAEAEYRGVANVVVETAWIRNLLETSGKDKALAILMVQPWERVARQRITQSFSPNPEIFFPPIGEDEGTEGPMIIEAKIGGHCVHRMYVDGGSTSEIMYEHSFSRLRPEIKKQSTPATTPLIGFSCEIIWPIGKIQLLVKIGDEEHFASAWMNFMVVGSQSPYNGIIGSPRVRKLQAAPSTAHGMLKIQVEGGVITLKSSKLFPLECAMVSGPSETSSAAKPIEEIVKVAINPEYPEQTIGRNLEVYVDDLVIKSHTEDEIVRDVEETFKTLREINMKINPKKCAFGVEEKMFLGYKVNAKGLKVCPDKVDAVLSLPSLKCLKDVQKLNRKLASLNRALRGPELNYTSMEKLVLALVHASKRLNRLRIAEQMGVKNLQANVDSRLVTNQVNRTYVAKEADMICYLEKSFYKWGIDIAGPFPEGPRKVKFLIVAMNYFIKWIETKPVATITGNQIKKCMTTLSIGSDSLERLSHIMENSFGTIKIGAKNYVSANTPLPLNIRKPMASWKEKTAA
nr:reverse transcriptase domain-containing protein [Tanacetum cinerariifolium]